MRAMDDLPLQRIQISGPTLSSIFQRFSSSPGDVDGILFGHVTHTTPSTFSDDNPSTAAASSDSPTLIATITSFFCSNSTSTFYSSTGQISTPSLFALLSSSSSSSSRVLGWFSGRRKTPIRPSLRESLVTFSLSSKIQFSIQVDNYTLSPSIFLLLSTPLQDQIIHTHEYKAYQFRLSTLLFEPKTLDIVNIGPAFRSHYDSFCPNNSPLPLLTCKTRDESQSLTTMRRLSKDRRELDMCAEEFDVGRLNRLVGPDASNYTGEIEDLYKKMLAKMDLLARLVEESSARVLEQENHNMKLRYKVAGLE